MSLSAATSRPKVVTRSPSNTSLNVGLPPPIPSSTYQTYTSPNQGRRHHRPDQPHRGDVSSTATSDDGESEDEGSREPGWVLPPTPARVHVPGALNGMESSRKIAVPGKRMTLQERLAATAAAAKMKKSDSNASVGMSKSSSTSTIVAKVKKSASSMSDLAGGGTKSGDKVVVCVRIKPTTSTFSTIAYDISRQDSTLTLADAHPNVVKRGGKSGRESEYTYTFDALLEYPARTPDLYEDKIAPLVDKTMNGFNSTIFAYGQTGSGKSFTMTGTRQELGIIPCAVDGVFDAINNEPDRAFLLRVSYVEIYNETIRDLLNFKKGPLADDEKPVIHTQKGKVYVEPLKEEIVSTPQEVIDLLERGNLQRRTGATDWNERSSRSHSVFTITVESSPRGHGADTDTRRSCLNLIDLAGSEKAVSDLERRGEGKHINQSLLALREVINKLTEKHKKNNHIPYRNSKLTHLLENALDGQSNIAVICTLSVEEAHCAETLETLKFAGRCSQVETKAQKNILPASEKAVIRAKEDEINELKRQLQQLSSQDSASGRSAAQDIVEAQQLQADVLALEDRKNRLATQLAKLNGEILTSQTFGVKSHGRPRRRISDSARGLGVGLPQPALGGRRAVSGMSRVSEDSETPVDFQHSHDLAHHGRSFDLEREIASLRRTLVAKEAEMVEKDQRLYSATEQIGTLQTQIQHLATVEQELKQLQMAHHRQAETVRVESASTASRLGDMEAELERTRQELALSTEEKDTKLAGLEKVVLELRRSREDLLVEDQRRYDDIEKQLVGAREDLARLQSESEIDSEALTRKCAEAESAKLNLSAALDSMQKTHTAELNKVQTEFAAKLSEVGQKAEKAGIFANKCKDLAEQLQLAQREATKSAADRAALAAILISIEAARDAAVAQAAATQADNERMRLDAADNEAAIVTQLRKELAKSRADRQLEDAAARSVQQALAEESAKLVESQRLLAASADQSMDLQRVFSDERKATQKIQQELAANLVQLAKYKTALDQSQEELFAQNSAVKQRDSNTLSMTKQLEECRSQIEALTTQLDKNSTITIDLQAQNANLVQQLAEAKAQTTATLAGTDALQLQIHHQLDAAAELKLQVDSAKGVQQRAEAAEGAVQALQLQLDLISLASAASQEEHAEAVKIKEQQLEQLRGVVTKLEGQLKDVDAAQAHVKSQMVKVQSDLLDERQKRKSLEQQAQASSPAPAIRSRHASTPASQGAGAHPAIDSLQYLVASTTGGDPYSAASKLQSRERQEVHRLEKVVEGQKAVIEELKANLLLWQKQLSDQEKVVRMLTNDISPQSSPKPLKTQTTTPLSPSRRQDSVNPIAALGSSKTLFKAGSYGQLAVAGSPVPLPPHPTQKSNSSARKGRRITIEHDINRLATSRSIDRARAVFSQGEQDSTPSRLGKQQPQTLSMTPTRWA